jgi:hypothetical protein
VPDTQIRDHSTRNPSAVRTYSAEYWVITAAVMAFVGLAMLYKQIWWGILLLLVAAVEFWLAIRAHKRGYG